MAHRVLGADLSVCHLWVLNWVPGADLEVGVDWRTKELGIPQEREGVPRKCAGVLYLLITRHCHSTPVPSWLRMNQAS